MFLCRENTNNRKDSGLILCSRQVSSWTTNKLPAQRLVPKEVTKSSRWWGLCNFLLALRWVLVCSLSAASLLCCWFITSPTASGSTLSSRWYSSFSLVQDSQEVSSGSKPCHCTKTCNSGPSLEEAHLVANKTKGVIMGSCPLNGLGDCQWGWD